MKQLNFGVFSLSLQKKFSLAFMLFNILWCMVVTLSMKLLDGRFKVDFFLLKVETLCRMALTVSSKTFICANE